LSNRLTLKRQGKKPYHTARFENREIPLNQYSKAMWEELVQQGKLKHAAHGTYKQLTF